MSRTINYDAPVKVRLTPEMRDHVSLCAAECRTTPTEWLRKAIADAVVRHFLAQVFPFDASKVAPFELEAPKPQPQSVQQPFDKDSVVLLGRKYSNKQLRIYDAFMDWPGNMTEADKTWWREHCD